MAARNVPGQKFKYNCLQCGKEFEVHPCRVKRGNVKFCSISCGVKHRNTGRKLSEETKKKISMNHADVSGKNNPMYGRKGKQSPSYIDGRRIGQNGEKVSSDTWRCIAMYHKPHVCEICGVAVSGRQANVHHIDKNRKNNSIDNLQIVCVSCHQVLLHPRKRNSLGRFIKEVV